MHTLIIKLSNLSKLLVAVLLFFSIFVFGIYLFLDIESLLLLSVFILWLSLIIYSLINIHERIVLFFLQISIFTFILSRPILDLLRNNNWITNTYNYSKYAKPEITICILFISLCGIFLGSTLAGLLKPKRHISHNVSGDYILSLRFIAMLIFAVSLPCEALTGIEKILFRIEHSYNEYYTLFKSNFPYIIYKISTFNKYSLFFLLATKPSKKTSTCVLIINIILTIPDVIVGSRGNLILSCFFALFYYIYRDYCGDSKRWLGKKEKYLLITIIPIGIVFLGVFNYVRDGIQIHTISFINAIGDFFYKQGVTFSWISCGLGVIDQLPAHINYSFGQIIDYLLYGALGQLVWETAEIPSGNSVLHATCGNSLSHHLSYIILGNRYLNGHGTGSSYLLENFIDFGYIGVFILSFFIGLFIIWGIQWSKNNYFFAIIFFLTIPGIIFMPRSEFGSVFSFIIYIQFWFILIISIISALMLKTRIKKFSYK